MTDADRTEVDRIDRLLTFAAAVLVLWATVALSAIKPWGFANPPPEACRPTGQRATPATQHLPACPRLERRPATTTARQEPTA